MYALANELKVGDHLYYARVESLWKGDKLDSASVIVDCFIVEHKSKKDYTLSKPSSITGGQSKVVIGSWQDKELRQTRKEAVLALYQKMVRRVALVYQHPDVLNGKVSESAAILEGLT